ncbi:MAG: MATE family efflux transporter, partial [bacterium]|nr:MATE family efflux transporter [bacterium]
AIAAFGICLRLFGLIIMPLIGLSMGAGTITGQNLGNDNIQRAEKTAIAAATFGFLIMIIISTISLIFPEAIMLIFVSDPQVVEIGKQLIRITIPTFSLFAISHGLGAVFSGSGKNTPLLISGIVSKWIFQLPFMLVCVLLLKLDIVYVWISFIIAGVAELFIVIYFYKKGDWKYNRV